MQITIYRKGHMGTDHFLGEIAVPLREVEEVDGDLKEADIRRYTLGRRSAKDKVRLLEQSIMLLLHLAQEAQASSLMCSRQQGTAPTVHF